MLSMDKEAIKELTEMEAVPVYLTTGIKAVMEV